MKLTLPRLHLSVVIIIFSLASLFSQISFAEPTAKVKPFKKSSIYDLLLAELSLRRGLSDQAAQLYYDQAVSQQDSQLASHAAQIALTIEEYDLGLQAAQLWLRLSPGNHEAERIKTISLINVQPESNEIEQLLASNAKDPKSTVFTHLALHSEQTSNQWMLLNKFTPLLEKFPRSHNLLVGSALLNHHLGFRPLAEQQIDSALKLKRDIDTLTLNVDISQGDRKASANKQLLSFLKKNMQDIHVQEQALNTLSSSDPEAALEVLNDLLDGNDQPNLSLLLAKTNIQLNKLRNADAILQPLLLSTEYKPAAHYLLGLIKRKQNRTREAIPHFFLARDKEYLVPATEALVSSLIDLGQLGAGIEEFKHARAKARKPSERLHLFLLESSLLQQTGNDQAAIETYDKALVLFPESPQLLYSRALVLFKLSQNQLAVKDLHNILKKHPAYSPALNALAYHYADTRTNTALAEKLIDQALALAPNEAQYLDTKGWVKYAQRDLEAAQQYLEKAHQLNSDPQIAAHLIEILWAQAKLEESVAVWKSATAQHPSNNTLYSLLDTLRNQPERFADEEINNETNANTIANNNAAPTFKTTETTQTTEKPKPLSINENIKTDTKTTTIDIVYKDSTKERSEESSEETPKPLSIQPTTTSKTTIKKPSKAESKVTFKKAPIATIAAPTSFKTAPKTTEATTTTTKTSEFAIRPLQNSIIPSNSYAIQLIGTPNQQQLSELQSKLQSKIPTNLKSSTYRYTINNQELQALIIISFSNYQDAKKQLSELPAELKKHGAWVIKSDVILERMASTPQKPSD